jgi:hypothetical protein
VLTLALDRAVVVLTVVAIAARRGSAEAARALYIQHEPADSSLRTQPRRQTARDDTASGAPAAESRPERRPGKRDRRQAAALKRHGGGI